MSFKLFLKESSNGNLNASVFKPVLLRLVSDLTGDDIVEKSSREIKNESKKYNLTSFDILVAMQEAYEAGHFGTTADPRPIEKPKPEVVKKNPTEIWDHKYAVHRKYEIVTRGKSNLKIRSVVDQRKEYKPGPGEPEIFDAPAETKTYLNKWMDWLETQLHTNPKFVPESIKHFEKVAKTIYDDGNKADNNEVSRFDVKLLPEEMQYIFGVMHRAIVQLYIENPTSQLIDLANRLKKAVSQHVRYKHLQWPDLHHLPKG